MASASIDVYIKLPSGKAFSSKHTSSDTVKTIAAYVGGKENVPENRIRIKYQGKTLDKTKTIGYLGICAETILKAEVVFPKELNIFVKFPDGTCNPYVVMTTDSVQDLKWKIESGSGLSPTSQILQFDNGSTITGTTTLICDSGIVNESVLTVSERVTTHAPSKGDVAVEEEEIDEDKKQALMESFATEGKNIEVVFCFDTTGSMYSCLSQVRTNLRQCCERLIRDIPTVRIGIMAHGDYCDHETYVLRYTDLTSNVDTLVDFANNVPTTGGGDAPEVREKLRASCSRLLRDIPRMRIGLMANGDYCDYEKYCVRYVDLTSDVDTVVRFADTVPSTGGGGNGGECYEWALRKAQQLDWSEDSAKALVMIGDELPHVPSMTDQNIFWKDELDVLAGMGVKVYGVQALVRQESTLFYEEMAERTGGYYLKLNNFSLITDMFLAVCYRESNAEQLDAFVEEVQNEGRMTEDTKLFLDKLEQSPPKVTERTEKDKKERDNQRYVRCAWWDRTLDKGRVQYKYDPGQDSFRPVTHSYNETRGSLTYSSSTKKSRFRKFLCI